MKNGHKIIALTTMLLLMMLIVPSANAGQMVGCECEDEGYGFGHDVLETKSVSASQHYQKVTTWYQCFNCGQRRYEEPVLYYGNHSFDETGRCFDCGYTKKNDGSGSPSHSPEETLPPKEDSQVNSNTCKHTNIKSEKIGTSKLQQYDSKTHKIIANYKDICRDCGVVINTSREEITYRNHSFDKSGRCNCGYTSSTSSTSCKHTNKKSEQINSSTYQYNNDKHKIIFTYKDICKDCGVVINASRRVETLRNHYFGEDGRCTCGYTKAALSTCKHTNKKSEKIGASKLQKYDEKTHKSIATYKDVCKDCGIVVNASREKTTFFNHSFDKEGRCDCGYSMYENVDVYMDDNTLTITPIVTAYWTGCSGEQLDIPSISFENRTLIFYHPKYPEYTPDECIVINAFSERIDPVYYNLKASGGKTTFTFRNNLPDGSYSLYFSDYDVGNSWFNVTLGFENQIYMVHDSQPLYLFDYFDSGILNKSGFYLTKTNNLLTAGVDFYSRATFRDSSEFISELIPQFEKVTHRINLDPEDFHLTMYDVADPLYDYNAQTYFTHYYYVIGYKSWFLACNESGEVYITNDFTDDCYWLIVNW